MTIRAMCGAALLVAAALVRVSAQGQQLPKPENLQYFPKDMAPERLTQRMREFSFALGVRCQYCHVGGNGISFEGVVFKSDEKAAKQKARYMLRMVDQINSSLLAAVPSRSNPPVRVDCVTCHHGLPVPKTLAAVLAEIIDESGPAAAADRYKQLRENTMVTGRFDFGEWSINELARSLAEQGKTEAAVAMLEMNAQYYPKSPSIDWQLGELHRARGEREKAIACYKRVLEKTPDDQRAKARLAELGG